MPDPADTPTEVFPEPTFDELADASRPLDVPVDEWRDEAVEAIAQLSEPQHEVRPSLLLTVVTMLIFYVGVGLLFDWKIAPFVVLIVLVHEMGHYIAMKAFGYRELQMIFVPFFGAAVMGKKPEATQTQRAIVALAGPAPGMLLASGYAVAALHGWIDMPPDLGQKILLWTVIVNGFNLVPLEPLDGGQLFNALFYSRHPWLETVCKVFSAVIFAYLAVTVSVVFGIIAAAIVMSLRIKHSIALLSRRLREAGMNAERSLNDMPIDRLLKSYALAREFAPQDAAAKLEMNVRYGTELLQRAYPGALARPASAASVTALVLCYLLVVGAGAGAWRERKVALLRYEEERKQLEQRKYHDDRGDDAPQSPEDGPRIKFFK
jgi:Zn-dependent protease